MVRTNGPAWPSGRSAASTCQIDPAPEWAEHILATKAASFVAILTALALETPSLAGSAT